MGVEEEEHFIWIGRSDSSCSNCNRSAFSSESSHITAGWQRIGDTAEYERIPGCGVKWKSRQAMYLHMDEMKTLFNWDDMSKPFRKDGL